MKYLAALLLIFGFGLSGFGQTIKSLGYNATNGQVVANTGTNTLTFTNDIDVNGTLNLTEFAFFSSIIQYNGDDAIQFFTNRISFFRPIDFDATNIAAATRANLGFSTNLNTLWTATNDALGRTALGISSAKKRTAIAFAAEFYDDFSAYSDGTLVTNGFRPVYGPAYSLIYYAATNAFPLAPVVTNGLLRPSGTNNPPDGNETYYLTSILPSNVRSFGADVQWNTNANVNFSSVVFLIRTNNDFLGSFLHIPVSFTNTSIQWSTNGAGGLNTVTNVGYTNLTRGQTVRILGSIRSNVITLNVGGNIIKATNNFFESLAGRWFTFEQYGYGLFGVTDLVEVERVWANAAWQDAMTPNGTWDIYNPEGLRANIGFSTNLVSLWNATNASNARSAIGIGDTNAVAFSGIYNNGDFTNNNGTIYGLKTNVGPFEGIGNFFASNNTTVSNETLFRVGLAEATNKSAQFGFRVTRTNNGGEGVAVYSVFGYNALMMIGPSERSRTNYATNTNAGVEATLWTITPTNQVMTLRDTNTGATTLHQSLGFDTNVTSTAPANTTNIVKWIEVWVGTNSYRMPLYQ